MKKFIIGILLGFILASLISAGRLLYVPLSYALATHIEKNMPLTRTQISYDASNRPEYIGENVQTATNASTDWILNKITYNANGDAIDIEVAIGTWTDRVSNSQWK